MTKSRFFSTILCPTVAGRLDSFAVGRTSRSRSVAVSQASQVREGRRHFGLVLRLDQEPRGRGGESTQKEEVGVDLHGDLSCKSFIV